jgi:hypothetical protein
MPGYDELDAAGDWQPESDYGPIWFPHVEPAGLPTTTATGSTMPFYGWVWVADEPWGAAPFHYGRWVTAGGRWGWIPGPREGASRSGRPRRSSSPEASRSAASESPSGSRSAPASLSPLVSLQPHYINQINITNIHESASSTSTTTYVNIVNVTNVTYVNRTVGVTAMNQNDFAAGHSTRTAFVKVDPQQVPSRAGPSPAPDPASHCQTGSGPATAAGADQ